MNIDGTFTKQINVSNLPSGLYFIKLIADNETYTSKIVIE
ncbi:MAG: T9SS type A sorting domain-containing protein [Bacteroidetes bacterium]|nr:T9SS type A sorting domain-containing protein [Bacteroidota bacterium]